MTRWLVLVGLLVITPGEALAQPSGDFVPVTDAMLQDPDPADWLMWRRTLDSWGYSPLDEIDRENVSELRMVWSRALAPGRQQGTPLAYDGVMYMPNPRDVIQAIDAATGDLIWDYRRQRPDDLEEFIIVVLTEGNPEHRHLWQSDHQHECGRLRLRHRRCDGPVGVGNRDPRLHQEPSPSNFGPDHRQRQGRVRSRVYARGRPRRLRHYGP